MKKTAVLLIDFYQLFLSFDRGLLRVFVPGGACRFEVSCSEYTKLAILEYGTGRGLIMGIKRVLSCQPWYRLVRSRLFKV